MYLRYGLGAVTAADYTNALNSFRAFFPAAIAELTRMSELMAGSSDDSNKAVAVTWKNQTIPRIQAWGNKILTGDLSSAQQFVNTTRGLVNTAASYVNASGTNIERALVALQEVIRTAAQSAVSTATAAARAGGEIVGSAVKGASEGSGISGGEVQKTLTTAVVGVVALGALYYMVTKR